jgi:hypothetical protein
VRLTRVPSRTWLLVAIFIAIILLIVLIARRELVQTQFARFKSPDPAHVDEIILDAQIPQSFNSKEEMFQALLRIAVPGSALNGKILRLPDGSTVWLESIEIPGRGQDRVVVFRELNGKLRNCDDFVYDPYQYTIADVRSAGEQLSYLDPTGKPVPVSRLQHRAPSP